jgi:metal-sulfur cluster biosynthetic enzyme
MDIGKVGAFCFLDAMTAQEGAAFCRRVEGMGYRVLWTPEAWVESHSPMAATCSLRTRPTSTQSAHRQHLGTRPDNDGVRGQDRCRSVPKGASFWASELVIALVEELRGHHETYLWRNSPKAKPSRRRLHPQHSTSDRDHTMNQKIHSLAAQQSLDPKQQTSQLTPSRARAQLMDQLHTVTDPELDEPLTDLGFIKTIDIDVNAHVRIVFKLPTYWCAANFAFMMAEDIRERIKELPWVNDVTVELIDHFSAAEINQGTAASLSFGATFAEQANGNLDDLRRIFQSKAFLQRQERLLRYLLTAGYTSDELVALNIATLEELEIFQPEGAHLRQHYLFARNKLRNCEPSSPAFVEPNGRALASESLTDYLKRLRSVSINMEFNGFMCRSLLAARYAKANRGGE